MSANKYATECTTCFIPVAKGEGVYEYPHTYCTESIVTSDKIFNIMCLPKYNRTMGTTFTNVKDARINEWVKQTNQLNQQREKVRLALVNGSLQSKAKQARVRSLEQVIRKHAGADIAITDLTWEQAVAVSHDLDRRIKAKENAKTLVEAKLTNTCRRCAGAGEADRWAYTGRVCYDCGGTGKFLNEGGQ